MSKMNFYLPVIYVVKILTRGPSLGGCHPLPLFLPQVSHCAHDARVEPPHVLLSSLRAYLLSPLSSVVRAILPTPHIWVLLPLACSPGPSGLSCCHHHSPAVGPGAPGMSWSSHVWTLGSLFVPLGTDSFRVPVSKASQLLHSGHCGPLPLCLGKGSWCAGSERSSTTLWAFLSPALRTRPPIPVITEWGSRVGAAPHSCPLVSQACSGRCWCLGLPHTSKNSCW